MDAIVSQAGDLLQVLSAIGGIAALIAGVRITIKGCRWLLAMLGGWKDTGEGYVRSSVSVDARGDKTVRLQHRSY